MKYIFGYGGFAREVYSYMDASFHHKKDINFIVDDQYYDENNHKLIRGSLINKLLGEHSIVYVCVGDPTLRRKIVEEKLPQCSYSNIYLRDSYFGDDPILGDGNIFCPGMIGTTNIKMGSFNIFNLNTTIGHDCVLRDYITVSPGANISGNCTIGNNVYIGTNAAIREGITICDNVTIGMGSAVVKNIDQPGTYVGVPAKKIG